MKKNTSILTVISTVVLFAVPGMQMNATDYGYGGDCGIPTPGNGAFGRISCVGGYSSTAAALAAAVSADGAYGTNYDAQTWYAPLTYGVCGRGFNSNASSVQFVSGAGYQTSAAAVAAAKASLSPTFNYNTQFITAYCPQ